MSTPSPEAVSFEPPATGTPPGAGGGFPMPEPPPPYRGKGDPTGERILEAAERLLRERGAVHSVRVADVAEAANISRQSVYLHFDNRAGLLEAVTRRMDEKTGFTATIGEIWCRPGQIL